jgi:hypothetical protein
VPKISAISNITYLDTAGNPVNVDFDGRKIKIVTHKTLFSCCERFKRVILGILAVVASVGFALITSKVRGFFTKTTKSTWKEEFPMDPIDPKVSSKPKKVSEIKLNLNPEIQAPNPEVKLPEAPKETTPNKPEVQLEEPSKKPEIRPLPKPPEGIIKNGYGEYLIYRTDPEGKKAAISEKEYESIFEIVEAARTLKGDDFPADRHTYLEGKIQAKLGKEAKLAFIPRTLYEQIFLHAAVQEEMDKQKSLNAHELGATMALQKPLSPEEEGHSYGMKVTSEQRKEFLKLSMEHGFWQLCVYYDHDYEDGFKKVNEDDYRPAHLIKVASKLNEVALGKFQGKEAGFTFEEMSRVQKEELAFFKSLADPASPNYQKAKVSFFQRVGLALRFRDDSHPIRGHEMSPLKIRDERDEQVIQKAMQLECTAEAVNHLILYRGAKLAEDEVTYKRSKVWDSKPEPQMLSYGTSLYDGALITGSATPFLEMRFSSRDAQAIAVPLKEQLEGKTPFHAFIVHPLIALGSQGEITEARTKIWHVSLQEKVYGYLGFVDCALERIKNCFKTDDSQEKVEKEFAAYKSRAFILCRSTNKS